MFGPVFHLTSMVAEEPDGHSLDFLVDWPEDKERQEAERSANPSVPMSDEELARFLAHGKEKADWELRHGRIRGT